LPEFIEHITYVDNSYRDLQAIGHLTPYPGTCPTGYALKFDQSSGTWNCGVKDQSFGNCSTAAKPAKTRGRPSPGQCQAGNPCDVATGNKFQVETDYEVSGSPLRYVRYYNSDAQTPQSDRLPWGWRDEYDRKITISTDDPDYSSIWNGATRAFVFRPDGKLLQFNVVGTPYTAGAMYTPVDPDTRETLTQVDAQTVKLKAADDSVETYVFVVSNYRTIGRLQSIASRSGVTLTLTYLAAPQNMTLASVTDSFGRSLAFTYSGYGHVGTVTDPAGGVTSYSYTWSGARGGSALLTDVYFPNSTPATLTDNPHKTYQYDSAGGTYNLSGIVDEASQTFASWTYDGAGRAISSTHAGGAESVQLAFNSATSTTVTDSLGSVRTYQYSIVQGIPKVSSVAEGTASASFTYDANGYPATQIDRRGYRTNFVYDARGLEQSRTEGLTSAGAATPRTRTTATTWHSTFRLPLSISVYAGASATGTALRTTSFTYDASGNALTRTITDPSTTTSRVWTYTYNAYGQVLTVDGPRSDVSDVSTYTYYTCTTGAQCGQVNTITDATGQITTYNSYNGHGQPTQITDPNGIVTTLAYDLQTRVTDRCVNGLLPACSGGELTHFTYWPTGLLKVVTLADGSNLNYGYDPAHRLNQITDGLGNKISYTLDGMGNRTSESAYDPTNVLARTRTRVFNTLNQLYQEIGAANTAAVTTTYGYDANGNQTSIAAPLARNTTNAFDELNRLQQITDPASGVTQFQYDALDNLTQVTDPRSLATTYQYNGFGDVKQLFSPDTGTTTYGYDAAGNLGTSTDSRNAITTYTYDASNRAKTVAYKIGTTTDQTVTFTYDAGTNGKGRLTGASDANHSLAWTYDALGRAIAKSQTVGTVTRTIGYAYTNGNLTTLTTPSGQSIVYGYTNGQVTSITINGTTLLNNVVYDPFGPARSWTWGNGTTMVRLRDSDGKPSQISSKESLTYSYDDAFRTTGITNGSNASLSWAYGYDALDRLTSATKTGTTQGWAYDANGNRLTQTGTVAGTYTIASTNNRVSSITGSPARTYTYNNAGSALTYGTTTLTYWNSGRMKTSKVGTAATTTYVYNALGQRVRKSGGPAGTVLYVYDEAGHLIGEYNSTGGLVQETVWLGDIPVATLRPGTPAVIWYVHADHLNTPRMVTRPSDNKIAWRWDSDPFGTTAPNQNPQALGTFVYNPRFPGQYYDSETGLNYNYFRDYDPAIARYVESDPIGLNGGLNVYRYAYSSPLEFIDPFGQAACVQVGCLPSFVKKSIKSTPLETTPWRLDNVSEDPLRPRNIGPLPEKDPFGVVLGSRTAICFFARTTSYKDEVFQFREWKCVEVCEVCGRPEFRENSYLEALGTYEKVRREREQQVRQITAIVPALRCMEILRGLR
jgi:RHS repeat-associated protein